ncbi:MAG: Fic family protein [Chloroflexi bacterium]|nr:MAG: Fic family protein [Chloroflexota bacterium]
MAKMIDRGSFRAPDPILAMPALTLEVTRLLEDLAMFRGNWDRLKRTQPEQLKRLRRIATVESVAASTRIEGAEVTNEEVASILDGLALEPMRSRDASEVRGYSDLLTLIYDQSTGLPITENYVRQMHKVLLQHSEVEAHHRGEYKRLANDVIATTPDGRRVTMLKTASPFETAVLMPRLVDEYATASLSRDWHPLILIADFVLWFLSIHPFLEGNGRLSRAMATLMLLKAGYEYVPFASLEKVVEDNKSEYYATLQRSQIAARDDARDYQPWLVFFLQALRAQQQNLLAVLNRDREAQSLTTDQRKLLDTLQRAGSASASQLASEVGRPSRTIRYNLAVLVERKLVEFEGQRRGRRYRLAETANSPVAIRNARPEPVISVETPVVQTEDSAVDRTEAGPLQESGSNFTRQANPRANSLLYASFVLGAVPEGNAPLTDHDLDVIEDDFRRLEPEATAVRATPEVSWWHAASAQPGTDSWQGWLLPGPVLSVMRAFHGTRRTDGQAISLPDLIDWWREVMRSQQVVMQSLGAVRVELGLWLQTYPSGQPNVIDLTFENLPTPTQGAPPSAVPPWSYRTRAFDLEDVSPSILRPAAVSLLRHFSYRHLEPTVRSLGL